MEYKPSFPENNDNISHNHPIREFILLFSGITIFLLSAFWISGLFINKAVDYISPEMEAKIFKSIGTSTSDFFDSNNPKQAKLQRMIDELQKCTHISYPLKIHLTNSTNANAMAFPGGRIIVFNGLMDKISSENGLCFILAHELAHFKNRDHLRGIGRGIVFTAVAALVTGASSDFTQLLAPTSNYSQAQYSQERENLADQQALQILNCYYGHVGGATDFFEAMTPDNKKTKNRLGHYFNSHPQAVQRINSLHQEINRLNLDIKEVLPLPAILNTQK